MEHMVISSEEAIAKVGFPLLFITVNETLCSAYNAVYDHRSNCRQQNVEIIVYFCFNDCMTFFILQIGL